MSTCLHLTCEPYEECQTEAQYPGGWFGESWNAPVCDPAYRIAAPFGISCYDCGVPIAPGDQGWMVPTYSPDGPAQVLPIHKNCMLRHTLGALGILVESPGDIGW